MLATLRLSLSLAGELGSVADLTPAQEIRAAAKLLRERVARVPHTWRLVGEQIVAVGTDALAGMDVIGHCVVPERAAYVVSMHPGVALAVADWLDLVADHADMELYEATADAECCDTPGACSGHPGIPTCNRCSEPFPDYCHCWDAPLVLARAYVGSKEN